MSIKLKVKVLSIVGLLFSFVIMVLEISRHSIHSCNARLNYSSNNFNGLNVARRLRIMCSQILLSFLFLLIWSDNNNNNQSINQMINVPGWGRQLLDDDFHIFDPQHQVFFLFDDIVPNKQTLYDFEANKIMNFWGWACYLILWKKEKELQALKASMFNIIAVRIKHQNHVGCNYLYKLGQSRPTAGKA